MTTPDNERRHVLDFGDLGQSVTVRTSPITFRDYAAVEELYSAAMWDDPATIRALFAAFAPLALIAWSFPEPADAAGLEARETAVGVAIVREWRKAVREVPPPLLRASSDGEPSGAQQA